MADIFVSYSRDDRRRVEPLVRALEKQGWSVWWDPKITPGDDFEKLIAGELKDAKSVIVVWSEKSIDSRWVKGEARDAADRGILAPVRFDRVTLPIDFRAIHTTDLDHWREEVSSDAFQSLCDSLKAKMARHSADARAAKPKADDRPTISICVLPFSNMSGDPEQEYFSDGVTEDIITDLSKIAALSVVSRNTAFNFKGKSFDVPQVARQTGVSHVLEGSVRKAGNRVRITAQLIDAENDDHVWAERFDRDLDDIFALQDEISEAVVSALKLNLLPEEKRALEQKSTTNPKAYKFYLMARQFSIMGNERHQEIIVRLCQRAVELDPAYARAWATMAVAKWNIYWCGASNDNGQETAERALALDPNLADAHAALGAAHHGQGHYEIALKHCLDALNLDPNSYEGNFVAGMCCLALKRFDDAIGYFETAANVFETEFTAANFVTQSCVAKGDVKGAKIAAKRTLDRIEKVIAVEPDHGRALSYGASCLATLGEKERALEWIERGRILDPDNSILQYNFACALVQLNEFEAAIELLESVVGKAAKGSLDWFRHDSDLDPLRGEPNFQALMANAEARFADGAPAE